ncbi:MAG: response regulator [Desulfobacterales bacterium]|nr:response regulator [Desulfobacterales bacterium]
MANVNLKTTAALTRRRRGGLVPLCSPIDWTAAISRSTKAYCGNRGDPGRCAQCGFDVAVLDLKMEDMDGIEVLRIFKKMAPDLAVIMLTGHGSATAALQGMQEGAFDYLTKPCELDELLEKIAKACAARGKKAPAG